MPVFIQIFIRALAFGVISLISFIGLKGEPATLIFENKELPSNLNQNIKDNAASTFPPIITPATITPTNPIPKAVPEATPSKPAPTKVKNEEKFKITVTQNPVTAPIVQKILPPPTPISQINDEVRLAVVNILCTTLSGTSLHPITGSGVIIDQKGIVLTNAHIAQYFLLRDYPVKDNVDCLIRTGSPAYPTYRASLLFIPPAWIEANYKNITLENPLGTGENDFALLFIDSVIDAKKPLPSSFPAVTPNIEELTETSVGGDTYLVAGYPAGFLGGIAIFKDLFLSSTVAYAQKVYTFKENTIDLLSLGGSVLAQRGSSGGAVVRLSDKKLVGIIVTTTDEKTTGERDLRAVTTTHINRSLEGSANITLAELLLSDPTQTVRSFKEQIFPQLKALLVNNLPVAN